MNFLSMLWQRSILFCYPDCHQNLPHQYYVYIYIVEVYNTLHGPSGVVHYELSGVAGGDITQQWPNETQGV